MQSKVKIIQQIKNYYCLAKFIYTFSRNIYLSIRVFKHNFDIYAIFMTINFL